MGPCDVDAIRNLVKSGRLVGGTPVRAGRDGRWQPLEEYPELSLAAAGELPLAVEISRTGTEVKIGCPHCGQHYTFAPGERTSGPIVCVNCGGRFSTAPDGRAGASGTAAAMAPAAPDDALGDGPISCPHCWRRFSPEQLLYIASHPALIGDPVAGEHEPLRFTPTVFNAVGQPLDARGAICTDMACPRCHQRIPATVMDLESRYFSIVGAPSSGKSYYLTSLVHALKRNLPRLLGRNFLDVDPLMNSVLGAYERTLFMSSEPDRITRLPKTEQIGVDFSNQVLLNQVPTDLPKPFVFQLSGPDGAVNGSFNAVFYDNAGEHFQPGADVLSNPATRHLSCSDGLVFLFDPVNDSAMRSWCNPADPQLGQVEFVYDQAMLLAEMINRIRRHRNLSADRKCELPLVIAINKYDVWRDRFPGFASTESLLVPGDGKAEPGFDFDRMYSESFALRELLLEINPALVNAAESFFDRVVFLAVSSFGAIARRSEDGFIGIVPSEIAPMGVEKPFLALLALLGVLPEADPGAAEKPDRSFSCSLQHGLIVFPHPADGHRVRLPMNYLGRILTIDGRRCAMPPAPAASRIFKDSGLWD